VDKRSASTIDAWWMPRDQALCPVCKVLTRALSTLQGFLLNGQRADFHRPHPQKEALKYRVKATREFLENAGIKP
jgi:hypothetical protein